MSRTARKCGEGREAGFVSRLRTRISTTIWTSWPHWLADEIILELAERVAKQVHDELKTKMSDQPVNPTNEALETDNA